MNLFLFLYSLFYIFMMTNAAKLISRSGTITFYCIVLYLKLLMYTDICLFYCFLLLFYLQHSRVTMVTMVTGCDF